MRVEPLKKKCSALTQGLELQNLHLDPLSMTISAEDKSLNNDNFISEMLQIQALHTSELPEPTVDELATAMDEFAAVIEGAPVGAWTPGCSFFQHQRSAQTYCYHSYEPEAQSTRDDREWAGYALPTKQLPRFPNHIPPPVFR